MTSYSSSSSSSHSTPGAAQTLLKLGRRPSTQSLNHLLSLLLRSRKLPLLLHLFSQMSSNSIRIDSRTHSIAARALLKSRRFDQAEHFIVTAAERFGFSPKKSIFESLIRGLSTAGEDPERAFYLLQQCIQNGPISPSLITFRLLVLSLSSKGAMGRAVEVFEMMRSERLGYPCDNFVCSSIISGFSKIGKPGMGAEFYERLDKNAGFEPHLVTYTAAMDALFREGRVNEACELVSKIMKDGLVLDVVLYSSWIHGYFERGLVMEGLQVYKLMAGSGVVPDVVSYTVLVDELCKGGDVEKVFGLLKEMEKSGLKPNLVTYTVLVRGFCKRGKLDEALCVLRRMEELGIVEDEFVYAVLINGFCMMGDFGRVFEFLEEMERKGIEVGHVTYNTVINGLCKDGRTCKADELSKGFIGDNFTYSTLLHGYMKEKDREGALRTKKRLEEGGICMDVVTCNVLIKALFMAGMVEDACRLFKRMPEMGLAASDITYCSVIDGLCKQGLIHKALEVFDEYRRTSVSSSSCHNYIIIELCKASRVEMAVEVFKDLVEKNLCPDSSIYKKLIRAYFKEGNGEGVLNFIHAMEKFEPNILSSLCNDAVTFLLARGCFTSALEVYLLMRKRHLNITGKSYYVLLKGLLRNGDKGITQVTLSSFIKTYGIFEKRVINVLSIYLCKKNVEEAILFLSDMGKKCISLSVLTSIVESLKKEGRVEDACKLLIEAEGNGVAVDVVVCSIVVDGLCKEGHLEKALNLCESMRKKGIHPNIVIYNSVINGLCQQGCFIEAFRLFDSLEDKNVLPTLVTYGTLIDALCNQGFLQDASHLFEKMIRKGISPNTHIYNSLINGYCSSGLIEEGLKLLFDMEQNSLQADGFTVSAMISGYCLKGDMEGALDFFNEFKRKGLYPDFLGFLNLIRGLFAKGRMEEARSILRHMLQCTTIVDLINRAGDDLHIESLGSLLDLACEQGRIQEVILVLNEVGSVVFSSQRPNNENRVKAIKGQSETGTLDTNIEMIDYGRRDVSPMVAEIPKNIGKESQTILRMDKLISKMGKGDNCMEGYEHLMGKSLYDEFDTYYSVAASLCSKGDLQKANSLVRKMLLNTEES